MRRLALSLLGLAASAAAIVILLQSVDLAVTLRVIGSAQIGPLLAVFPLVALGIWLRSWRWQRLLPEDGRSLPVRRIAPVVLIGYLGNSVLPARMGEPIRSYVLARREGFSMAAVFGSALLERIVDLSILAVMALAGSLLVGAPAWAIELSGIASAGGLAITGLLAAVGLEPILGWLRTHSERASRPRTEVVLASFDRFAAGIGGPSRRLPLVEAGALSLVIWLVDGSICWLVASSLGLGLSLAACVLVVGIGALGTSIPSAPGYVGTYELATSTVARALGVQADAALGFAVMLHGITLLPVALSGVASLLMLGSGSLLDLASASAAEQSGSD
jgi:glycosyltransferase 2 family protein